MKAVSAAIVVVAGALLMSLGGNVSHNDTRDVLMLIGGAVGVYGLVVWHLEIRKPTSTSRDSQDS